MLIFNSLAGWIYTYTVQDFPSPFPDRPLLGALITTRDLGVIARHADHACAAVRVLPLHLDRIGDARGGAKSGIRRGCAASAVGRMLAIGWGLAAAIGATAGIMVAPVLFLDPNMMGGVLLYAFAGALLGGITSPVGAVVGGLIVGVTENLVGTYLIAEPAQAHRGARLDHTCAGVQAERVVRHCDRAAGVTMDKELHDRCTRPV